jgi:membrane protein DedA with SNARE-associated domain
VWCRRDDGREEEKIVDAVNAFIATLVSTPWVPIVIVVVVLVDAFFPPVPSESLVIAAAAAAVSVGQPNIVLVVACAAVGAIAGDNLTFAIGRKLGLDRFRWMRGRRMRSALEGAGRGIAKRPAAVLMTARYVPVGRVAVNLVAGASGFPRRRFFLLSLLAGTSWAVYSVAIGLAAGHLLHGNTVLAMLVGIVAGLASGVVVDLVMRLLSRRQRATADGGSAEHGSASRPRGSESIGAE